jgi:uncharacterized protein with PhoU and TrkA domain
MTNEHRHRLTTLVAAGTKLDQASRLIKEAMVDLAAHTDRFDAQRAAAEVDRLVSRVALLIKEIPST